VGGGAGVGFTASGLLRQNSWCCIHGESGAMPAMSPAAAAALKDLKVGVRAPSSALELRPCMRLCSSGTIHLLSRTPTGRVPIQGVHTANCLPSYTT
jgi:hypothetical protein